MKLVTCLNEHELFLMQVEWTIFYNLWTIFFTGHFMYTFVSSSDLRRVYFFDPFCLVNIFGVLLITIALRIVVNSYFSKILARQYTMSKQIYSIHCHFSQKNKIKMRARFLPCNISEFYEKFVVINIKIPKRLLWAFLICFKFLCV